MHICTYFPSEETSKKFPRSCGRALRDIGEDRGSPEGFGVCEGSENTYAQGDCNLKGFKVNKRVKFSLPMGEGEAIEKDFTSSWEYYQRNSGYEILLNFICQMSKLTPEGQKIRIEELTKRNEKFERERREFLKEFKEEDSPQLNILKSLYIKREQ